MTNGKKGNQDKHNYFDCVNGAEMIENKLALAEWISGCALKNGADQAAVSISEQRSVNIEFRDKKTEQISESLQRSLSLEIYAGQRYSVHSANDLRKEFLSGFVRNAAEMTAYLARDEYRALPDPEYYVQPYTADLKFCDETYNSVAMSRRMEIAAEIEAAARAQSGRIISVSSGYSDSYSESVRVQSNGFSAEVRGTGFSAGAEVTVSDPDGGRPEDWFSAGSRFYNELPDTGTLGKKAAERALAKIGQKKIASGKYDMILENRAGLRLISTLQGPMGGGALQQKSSFLEGMLGRKVASEALTMTDEPFIVKGFGSRFFDGEGLAAQKRVMIGKGVLTNYYIDTYYGRKLGMTPTSGSGSNTVFEYGSRSLEEMIRNLKRGILVTGFIGGNSNSTTGDFSFGIVGMLIENGVIVKPVNEMNISGNAKEFWHRLTETGNDPYPYSAILMPSMRFDSVSFSGI